jgi:Fe2+ transport system protein B
MDDINKYTDDNPIKLVVGNKSDLSDQRQVSQVDINKFKQQTGIPVMEASAKNSFKITEVMETIARMLISKKTKTGVMTTDYNTPSDQEKIMLTNKNNNEQSQDCCSFG